MATVLSLIVLAAAVLCIGAAALWRRGGSKKQIALMLLLALVMAVNVAIWTLPGSGGPGSSGEAPLDRELR